LQTCTKAKLFVHGANDEHGEVTKVEKLVAELPGANRFVVVPAVDHFFTGKLDQLDRAITSWLTDRHPDL
jgi:uncharacterized protein